MITTFDIETIDNKAFENSPATLTTLKVVEWSDFFEIIFEDDRSENPDFFMTVSKEDFIKMCKTIAELNK